MWKVQGCGFHPAPRDYSPCSASRNRGDRRRPRFFHSCNGLTPASLKQSCRGDPLGRPGLLQPGVLRLGLLEDEEVGVGVLPQRRLEETSRFLVMSE